MEQYRDLLAKADNKFNEVRRRHPSAFACRAGCHGCCQPGLTIARIERDHIRAFLEERPNIVSDLETTLPEPQYQGTRCFFLNQRGECAIYTVRPLICRSHGTPISFQTEDGPRKDVCPLNFKNQDLESLANEDFLNIDLANTILSLAGRIKYGDQEAGDRFPLTLEGVLNNAPLGK
jgi:uncharacterized protein